jgi:hypothetical protein
VNVVVEVVVELLWVVEVDSVVDDGVVRLAVEDVEVVWVDREGLVAMITAAATMIMTTTNIPNTAFVEVPLFCPLLTVLT